ncbi:MAG TPA: UDP-N-acetylglucosamine 2-epimerase (non-hydrolyzing) [Anaerohalosphaeraceae bacterium]|nr:UDP-N-acetylglucosamine 2-epimerase (non-hydrolyzing) [Anaerohalosphaeraceae bacterium]HPB92780.1 UDP-N-acetylglucosamine 2-epimerase (non-hydrolyzing) [Anaerohalosphaeraceae bacterium]
MTAALRILTILGARPQFIKAAAVSRAIQSLNRRSMRPVIEEKIVHTGQHYDENMSAVFFEEMAIPAPAYSLGVGSADHGAQTGRMLEKIEEVLQWERPHLCMVYGDTNTTLAGALAAVKQHIPTAHIEAGLRSYDRRMPEEINRLVADQICEFRFCPTRTAVENLQKEGIYSGVFLTGDVMYDCLLFYRRQLQPQHSALLGRFGLAAGGYFLATIHRAENTDDASRLEQIIAGLSRIAETLAPVLLPLHPRTAARLEQMTLRLSPHLHLIEPVSYLTMLALETNARAILTDSGGVQKEAYFLRVPCLTFRDRTEWPETVRSGWNTLAEADAQQIIRAAGSLQRPSSDRDRQEYGDGKAAEKIVQILLDEFKARL